MKKAKYFIAFLVACGSLFLISCDEEEEAKVNFAASSYSAGIEYGIKLGKAVWDAPLSPGEDTLDEWGSGTTVSVEPKSLQIKNADGSWTDLGAYYEFGFLQDEKMVVLKTSVNSYELWSLSDYNAVIRNESVGKPLAVFSVPEK